MLQFHDLGLVTDENIRQMEIGTEDNCISLLIPVDLENLTGEMLALIFRDFRKNENNGSKTDISTAEIRWEILLRIDHWGFSVEDNSCAWFADCIDHATDTPSDCLNSATVELSDEEIMLIRDELLIPAIRKMNCASFDMECA